MSTSNYPNGFPGGVTIRGVPVLNSYSGNIFWVDSVNGSDGNKGTFNRPFATINYAIGLCTANKGDLIVVKAGHAETLTSASAITCSVAGVSIIGLGIGADRPELTFSTAVGASIVISAANVTIQNIVGIAGIDSLTNPIHVQAAGCYIDMEWQDASDAVEAVRAVLGTASADNLYVKLKYVGRTGGDACVNAVRLVGTNGARIIADFYGKASTSWVEFVTTACSDVNVEGYMYNSGTTNGSKNVIDTVTGSTWWATIEDGAAGASYSGGSGAALAADDVSSIASTLLVPGVDSTANVDVADVVGNKTDAAIADTIEGAAATTQSLVGDIKAVLQRIGADSANNTAATTLVADNRDGSVLERLETIIATLRDDVASNFIGVDDADNVAATTNVVANKDGSILERLEDISQELSGTAGIVTFPASAAPANGVSLAEVMREIYDQAEKCVTNTTATLVNGTTIFTVAGGPIEILSLVARCVTGNDATASTLQWSADPTDGAAATFSAASASLANALAGATVVLQGTTLATAPIVNTSGVGLGQQVTNGIVVAAGIITTTVGVGSTTGTWQHHLRYRPLSRGVTVS